MLVVRRRARGRGARRRRARPRPTVDDHHDVAGAEDDASRRAARARDLAARRSRGRTSTSRACRTSRGCSRRARSPISRCAACAGCRRSPTATSTIGAGHAIGRRTPVTTASASSPTSRSARARRARRWRAATAWPPSTIPDVVDRVPRAARDRRPQRRAAVRLPRSSCSATRSRRPACSAPRSATATRRSRPIADADYRRWAPLALTDQNGIVPAGDGRLVVARTRSGRAVRLAARSRSRARRVRPDVERAVAEPRGGGRRGERPPAAPGVRLACSRRARAARCSSGCWRGVDALVGRLLQRVDPAHDAVLVVAPSQRGGPGRLTVASLRAPGMKPGLAVSSWTRHSGVVSIVDIGPTILDQLGLEPPTRMEGRPITFGRTGGELADRAELAGRHQQGRAVPRPRDRAGHGVVRRAADRADARAR